MGGLEAEPFGYAITKDGRIRITWRSKVVVTVSGSKASRLAAALTAADPEQVQRLLARATGNFKRGNERSKTGLERASR
ncbi:MAG TPA: hypothetical protein VJ979_04810 [Actinomycetota bacterium]|nr:hypothetical protein [Actinomycetota bacterium]